MAVFNLDFVAIADVAIQAQIRTRSSIFDSWGSWQTRSLTTAERAQVLGSTNENMTGQSWTNFNNNNSNSWATFQSQTVQTRYSAAQVQTIRIDTVNGTLSDDAATGSSGYAILSEAITLGGVTYPAGTKVENEFVIVLSGGYRFVAISATPPGETMRIIGYTFDGAWPPANTWLGMTGAQDSQSMTICLVRGTLIATPAGEVAIEALTVGDLVATADGRNVEIVWIGSTVLSPLQLMLRPNLAPICIAAGALGDGVPGRNLQVSPQHRVLVRPGALPRLFQGVTEALVSAKHLVGLPGIGTEAGFAGVEYFHILCRNHEVILANGAPVETLLLGRMALSIFSPETREEIDALFPELGDGGTSAQVPVAHLLNGRMARRLSGRMRRNGKPLLPVGAGISSRSCGTRSARVRQLARS